MGLTVYKKDVGGRPYKALCHTQKVQDAIRPHSIGQHSMKDPKETLQDVEVKLFGHSKASGHKLLTQH